MAVAIMNCSEEVIASVVKAENISELYFVNYGFRPEDGSRTACCRNPKHSLSP
jgi:hypothetical protein